ncbi:MAG: DUF4981 domain-containing protein [Dorea sp.]|jgi:beta-galactosidase|nr:DUF4981 domain-containing protein [Dorea sp.]
MRVFDHEKLKDPGYFKDARLDAHSDHRYYASLEDLELQTEEFKESLNGVWKFHYAKNLKGRIAGFERKDFDCRDWDDIHVPAHIQMEGYDAPQYANVQYPWEGHDDIRPGEIPQYFNPAASYVKYFTVPNRMKGKRIFISFQGAESGLALWLNGAFVGYSEDSFTPSEFELTEYIEDGENKLAVQVFKWTSASWCEDQDFYRFSGIYRDVYLYTVPDIHVGDMKISAIPDQDLLEASLDIRLEMMAAREDMSGTVRFCLSKSGEIVFQEEKALESEVFCGRTVKNPLLWSAEEPNLYDLLIEILDADGEVLELVSEKVGFRRFEMKNRVMTLNGKRIVFKGVNRHEFSSVSGRVVTEAELRKDLETIKQNNINAIRTCHYPNASLIYRLCDEYGIYMIDETNLESHGSWDLAEMNGDMDGIVPNDKEEWLAPMLDRVDSIYQRDKNHPAVLIWSCGNESFGGRVIYEMSQRFRKLDPTRLIHYEGVFHDRRYNDTSDMESQMYTPVEKIRDFLAKDRSKPFICCEYTHAMGNSCGAMHKYTDLTDTEELYQGGFIWDYIDQSIYKKDRYGKEYQAYGGDFGERPTDYSFSGNGIVYGGDREPSPKMQEVKFNYQNITAEVGQSQVKVINKNLFVNTDTFECVATVARDGRIIRQAVLETDVDPLSEKSYALPFSKETLAGEYTVTVSFRLKEDTIWAKRGHETAFGQYIYRIGQVLPAGWDKSAGRKEGAAKKPVIINSAHNIGVRGDNFEMLFSKMYGGLVSYKFAGIERLETIPKPNFWRAPVDNDCGCQQPMRYAQWKIASMYLSHRGKEGDMFALCDPEINETEDSISVSFVYYLPTIPKAECKVAYEVFGDGCVKTTLSYDPVKELGDMPEFGMMFKLDADYDHVCWYGLGPEETYADRKKGAKLGIFKNLVKDNMAAYLVPQECGNKEEVRYAQITDKKGRGMRFAMSSENGPMNFSALPYTPHEIENAAHPFELPRAHYTVVRVAKGQMGIGGDDSWGACTHPEYLLDVDKKMEFCFWFSGI